MTRGMIRFNALINYLKKHNIQYTEIPKTFSEDVGFYIVIPVFKSKEKNKDGRN